MHGVDMAKVRKLYTKERDLFERTHPSSKALYQRALKCYLYGTPCHWMQQWSGDYPIYVRNASGARITDVDGHEYADFALGDTGAMFGHSNPVIVEAIKYQVDHGVTMMLPTEDGVVVGELLTEKFGLPYWSLSTAATDSNRFCIRLARMVTGRKKVLIYNACYHGSVDETHFALDNGKVTTKPGVNPNGLNPDETVSVVEFNDVDALEQALANGDIACVLAEPMMTNCGMVPVQPGYHDALRELTRKHGTFLIIDETHTISTGPGGFTREYNLEPDMFVMGKSIAGGIPCGIYGVSEETAGRIWEILPIEKCNDHFGFGGTLVGNALTLSAMRATLEQVMTEENYAYMGKLAERFEEGVKYTIDRYGLPWHVTRVGVRAEYLFSETAPINGTQAVNARNRELEAFIHLYYLNRNVIMTPFHNMALMCPATIESDVDRHNDVFDECLRLLTN